MERAEGMLGEGKTGEYARDDAREFPRISLAGDITRSMGSRAMDTGSVEKWERKNER